VNLLTRRRKPTPDLMPPVTQLTLSEALAASAAGLTGPEWLALTDTQRAEHRTNISHGQHQENR
jgi:hypothetical protein